MNNNKKRICDYNSLKKDKINCLEIGAGSAIFSRTLKQTFPEFKITLLDKSFKNIPDNFKQKFADNSFELIEADAEKNCLKH